MSLRARPTPSSPTTSSSSDDEPTETAPASPTSLLLPTSPPPSSSSQRAISQTLVSAANLANLLPTGTLLAFQILTPIFTTNGTCDSATRPMTFVLLVVLAVSCFLGCFTDSVKATDGQVYHGLATFKGMFMFDYAGDVSTGIPDLRKYKIRFIDWVHAVLSVMVFGAVAFRDKNVVSCFYGAMPGHETQEVLDIVPVGVGLICSLLFVVFPTTRHGIGYPVSPTPAVSTTPGK